LFLPVYHSFSTLQRRNIPVFNTFAVGILMSKGVDFMGFKSIAAAMGLGAAAGAVAIMMMPRTNPARKLAYKAASKVEDAAMKVSDKITDKLDM
jgi:hypothetical protein